MIIPSTIRLLYGRKPACTPSLLSRLRTIVRVTILTCLCSFNLGTYSIAAGFPDLVVVKLPAPPTLQGELRNYIDGCSINLLSFAEGRATSTNLTPDILSARDPHLSFDARTIFFVGKKDSSSTYQVYRMNIDGSNIQQLTKGPENHASPLQVGTLFYLNDTEPVPQMVFSRQVGVSPVSFALFASNLDGTLPRRISHNIFTDLEPDVLPNGRLVYSSSMYNSSDTVKPLFQLMAVNIDGTDLMPVSGDQLPGHHLRMARIGFNDKIYFIEMDETHELSGGSIGSFRQKRPLHSYEKVTRSGSFIYPCPLPDGSLLASQKNSQGMFQLVEIEMGKVRRVLATEDQVHILDAQPVVKKTHVRGRSSVVGFRHKDSGVFFCMNVYESDRQDIRELAPGSVAEVLVTEVEKTGNTANLPVISVPVETGENATVSYFHRILGKAPVEKDGSFHIRVPSETPIAFHLLNSRGEILASQHSFTWVMHGESRGCIGCHEDRELSPPNIFIEAVKKPPVELLPMHEVRQPISLGEMQ